MQASGFRSQYVAVCRVKGFGSDLEVVSRQSEQWVVEWVGLGGFRMQSA